MDTRKLESSSYHALGACLSPYKAFLRRLNIHLLTVKDLCAAYAMNKLTASNRATGQLHQQHQLPASVLNQKQEASPAIVEPLCIENPFLEDQFQEDPPRDTPEVPMADDRTMAELLRAPTEGYEDAIQRFDESFYEAWERFNDLLRVCPHHGFSKLHQLDTFYNALNVNDQDSLNSAAGGNFLDKMPRECLKIIESKSKDMVRALLLDKKNQSSAPASSSTPAPVKACAVRKKGIGGKRVRVWLEKEAPRSIQTWDDLVSKYINQFFPLSKTTNLRNEITRFQQRFDESFYEAWERFNDLLRACPHHGFLGLHQLDTFYNALNINDHDSLNSAAGGNFLDKMPREYLKIIESKSKIQRVSQIDFESYVKANDAILRNMQSQGQRTLPGNLVAPVSALMPNLKPSLLYPSRHDNEKRNLGASINLMPFSVWEALLLQELTPTCMTLELADCSVSKPIGITKDVSFKTNRALIDVHKGELTLRIGKEAITYNLDQTVSDFLLFEEADAFLGLEDDPNSPKINPFYYDPKGDILLLETILSNEPLPPLPNHKQYLLWYKKELKVCEAKTIKSSVDEPPEVELKDLPHHLEYAFLEGDNKLPVIIAKDLGDEEKSAHIKVLKSHKRAIAWKLSDIQEVEKLLDAGLMYPISDSPWVSPVHYVPKKGGFTVVENKENELIPTRLVTG
nr:reverse transcriptase domain-containing protein [Tanacetum cinerariifolium]